MALLKRMIGLLLLALGLLGCGTPADGNNGRNLTIMLQCAETRPVPLNVVGEVSVDTRTLGTSNCSVYSYRGVITVQCPRTELPVSLTARKAQGSLPPDANASTP